jgi:hypothetical protein
MIKFVKLANGETLLTDVIAVNDRTVTVLNPIEVVIKGNAETVASMIGYQWLPFIEDENIIEVNSLHIVAVTDAPIRVKEFYVDIVDQYLYPEKYEKEKDKYAEMLKQIKSTANTEVKTVH